MPGLLEALDTLLSGSGISAQISDRAGELQGLSGAVQALTDGPAALTSLRQAAENLPTPSALDGLAGLSTRLSGVTVPTDLDGLLQPVLGPLTGLEGQLAVGVTLRITAAFDLIREIIRITTGQTVGGPSGMPDAPNFRVPDGPSPEELRGLFGEANRMFDSFEGPLDAARIVSFLQQAAPGFRRPLFWIPQIPVVDDVMRPLATVASWQTLSGDQLSAQLAETIHLAARLIDAPRREVAQPFIDAARLVSSASTDVAARNASLAPVLNRLRDKVTHGNGRPSFTELRVVEETAEYWDRLSTALDPGRSPLARVRTLDEDLTRAMLAAVRALQPAYNLAPLAERLRELIGRIPAAPPDVFAEVLTALDEFDLSVLTDPLQSVTQTVRDVVDEVHAARDTVRQALEDALSPVADALDAALQSVGFDQVRQTLQDLPGTVENFVDNEITPNLQSLRDGIHSAVDSVSGAADQFDPQALIAPLRDAVEQAAALLRSDEVKETFAQVEEVLTEAVAALEGIDLGGAADESIGLIGDIEVKLADIDPNDIPDAAKPLLRQGVQIVTDIDFTAEVSDPLLRNLEQALQQGPAAILGALEEQMDEVRTRIESFRPSQAIGAQLDRPFEQLTERLKRFKPSDLLGQLQAALDALAGRFQVLDVGAVVDPLVELHGSIRTQIEALRPSRLLQPVDQAIQRAIDKVYEATGIDDAFAGIQEVLQTVQNWTGLLADARDLLNRGAGLLEQPGDADAAVRQIVDDAVARLDTVNMARLQEAFQAASNAVAGTDRNALSGDLAPALQSAGQAGPALFDSPAVAQANRLFSSFPLSALEGHRPTPDRKRLLTALHRWQQALERTASAQAHWAELGADLTSGAGQIQERLLDYYRVRQLEQTSVFADFANPPTTTDALKESVRAALTDAVQEPILTTVTAFQAFAPYVRILAQGVSQVLDALHRKVDSLVGDTGVGGAVDAIEEAANLLRSIDLEPITAPLDAIYQRVETAVDALDPTPLRTALEAARDALASLLSVSTLINPEDVNALDQTYATAVDKIGQLAPSRVISQTLDPVYADLLSDILPVLDLPKRLRELVEGAGSALREEAVAELVRVEDAFDRMLRAIPLNGGGGAGGSVSTGISVGG